ncbi:Protein ENHANCED DISEASE RESISTANCE 4 [Linum perenne]
MTSVENGGVVAAAAPKIRLVRCPRCRQVLPELPNVPVYKCGGCGIHLQAKIRPQIEETNSPSADSAHLSRLESSSSSSVHQSTVQDSSPSSVSGVTSLDLGSNTKDSTLVADDDRNSGEETGGSNRDASEEIEKDECGDQKLVQNVVDSDSYTKDQVVEDEVAHGEASPGCSTDSASVSTEVTSVEKQDVGVDSESEVEVPNVVATVEDHLEPRRPSSDVVSETMEGGLKVDVIKPNEQLNRLQERVRFDPKREADEFVSSELSEMLVDLTKSPTTRSCHAYYDGISSYEGTDDQVPGRPRPYSRSAYIHKPQSYMIAEEKPEGDYVLPSRNNLGLQYQQKKYHSPDMNLDSEEVTGIGHPASIWGRLETDDELLSLPPLHPRNSYMNGYESGSTSYQSHSGLHSNSNSHHPLVNAADIEQERIRLLRMVYELEDQLTRSCSLNDNVNRKVFSGNVRRDEHVPLNYGMDPRPYSREVSSWSQQQRQPSRIPFSAEATTNGRHKVDHHSSCYNPQEWKCSGQLPTHCSNHNRVFCRAHSGANLCNSYGSCPSSPQRHMGPEYSSIHGRTTMSCEQRNGRDNRDLNRYIRKKQHFAASKRHLRPVAGGAPFLACHFCLKQLQLPADFLLSKRKFHMLRCGACSEILKFSLENRTHLVLNSTEADHAPPRTSFHHESRSIANSSSGSFKQQKKAIPEKVIIKSNGKSPVETRDGTRPSYSPKNNKEKASAKTENEEIQGRGGSPLHRLMGYNTLSGVLRN